MISTKTAALAAFLGFSAATASAAPLAMSQHSIAIAGKPLAYATEAGFTDLTDASGEVHAHMFSTAYAVKSADPHRPVAFVFNGGPGAPSSWLQFQGLGPRLMEGSAIKDNPETPLPATDMVFIDPIGTGYSRPVKAEYGKEYFSTVNDAKSVTQFIHTWLKAHHAEGRPVFIIGESFGGYRAGGITERLESEGQKVAGVILISGGVASGPLIPPPVRAALTVPQRAVAALALGKIAPDIGADRVSVNRAATQWALSVYLPALVDNAKLSDAERDAVIKDLSRFTGYPAEKIDRKTLTIANRDFLKTMSPEPGKSLVTYDMRVTSISSFDGSAIGAYYKSLGVTTDLAYFDAGFVDPMSASGGKWVNDYRWPESAKYGSDYAEPWLPAAMKIDPKIKVWVAAGQYDSLNSCAENDVLLSMLEPDLAGAYTMRCYLGGHMIYRDPQSRITLSADIRRFVRDTAKGD